jgi:PAS domain S-box-containing protein
MAIGSKNQGSPAKGLKVKRQENGQPNVFQEPVFRLAVNLSLDGIILTNLDGFISYVNEAVLKIYGSDDKNDLLGKHVLDFLAEKDRQKAMRISIECLTTGEGKFDEFTVLTKKGFEVPVEITKAIIKDESGERIGFIDIIRNISERKKIEEMLKNSEEKYRLLFENLLKGFAYCKMIFKDEQPVDFIYLEANDAIERLSGIKKSEIVGKSASTATPELIKKHPELFQICSQVALTGKSQTFELMYNSDKWFSYYVFSPKKEHFAFIIENITEKKELEKKLERSTVELDSLLSERTKQLEEAHKQLLKSERLAAIGELAGMIGHDLRNPLTSMKNAVYLLRKRQATLDETGNEMLAILDKSIEYSNKIVEDLLDYSRELRLELEEYSPKSLIDYLRLSIKPPEGIVISVNVQSLPLMLVDAAKIQRVFTNLIMNAFEAMPHGGTLEISSRANGDNVDFMFKDSGKGMSDEVMSKLFTPLFTTKAQGMGFGLSICKRIVEAHGGKITVTSTLNKGTTFTVTLPSGKL